MTRFAMGSSFSRKYEMIPSRRLVAYSREFSYAIGARSFYPGGWFL